MDLKSDIWLRVTYPWGTTWEFPAVRDPLGRQCDDSSNCKTIWCYFFYCCLKSYITVPENRVHRLLQNPEVRYALNWYFHIFKNTVECMCCLRNIAMHDYQESVTTWQTHGQTTGQTDAGHSDPYVPLRFADNTKKLSKHNISKYHTFMHYCKENIGTFCGKSEAKCHLQITMSMVCLSVCLSRFAFAGTTCILY